MLNPDFRDMLSAFIAEETEFLVVGAYALSAHGVPRATGDLDCWVARSRTNAARVLRALQHFGAPTEALSLSDLQRENLVFQIGVEPNRIDVLTSIDGVEFNLAWRDRLVASIDGLAVPILSRHHLLANKRAVGRPQDIADVSLLEAEVRRQQQAEGGAAEPGA
jgi:hypothetical protein